MHIARFITFFVSTSVVQAHSWIDNISQLDDLTNTGYTRGYAGHVDSTSSFLIQSNASSTTLCRANQLTPTYASTYPMLSITAGKSFVSNYSENGHVTKDALSPDGLPHPGTYSWYLSSTTMITLGDAYAARLLATGNFDDGVCAEDGTKGRAGPRQCQSKVSIPSDLKGQYALTWLWTFPKVEGVVEMYSSCMDINIIAGAASPDLMATSTTLSPTTTSDKHPTLGTLASSISSSSTASAFGNVAVAMVETSSSALHTRTSIIYQTTRIYTTIEPLMSSSSDDKFNRLSNYIGSMSIPPSAETSTSRTTTTSTYQSTRTSTSTTQTATQPQTGTTTTTAAWSRSTSIIENASINANGYAVLVSTVIQEVQQNPLEDANNAAYQTTLVTKTLGMPSDPSALSTPSEGVVVAVVMVYATAYLTVTAAG